MKYKPVPTWEDYEIAKRNGISKTNVDARISINWDIERAITQPLNKFDKYYVELAKNNGIAYHTYLRRLSLGWSEIKAATKPTRKYKKKQIS
ncbi:MULTISPECIES: hypothetical protein [Bacillus]|uniref:Uncharacterized protein n=1 Tax=Bacillus thuringiensis HD-771 TaxID=1218175 RepID=A0A9W3P1C7_BACTU|nr:MULTISPECIES: hypothetical protein [Bacillus cereus group]AFQ20035.1 hypothetical protein BTG_33528 [Bacillus thuringiensis HD-771]ETT88888.1 hypothetical protein C175_00245 [Bacillus cereus]MEC3460771.1 hypothetical protein [Bacillus thuringiensis]MEC3514497.1 hypothetical protein [Bacillus thuringiensis]MEC3540201.1 hypothetical protein [Bacillus thuringiensis]